MTKFMSRQSLLKGSFLDAEKVFFYFILQLRMSLREDVRMHSRVVAFQGPIPILKSSVPSSVSGECTSISASPLSALFFPSFGCRHGFRVSGWLTIPDCLLSCLVSVMVAAPCRKVFSAPGSRSGVIGTLKNPILKRQTLVETKI